MGVKVVETKAPDKTTASAGMTTMEVTIQGDSVDEISSFTAKNVAYDERKKHGLADAGIEAVGGPWPVDVKTGKPIPVEGMADMSKNRIKDIRYRRMFRLVKGL